MERRILRITGEFATEVVKRYKDSVVGDSPEMARALDSYGFADLELSMLFHVSLTSVYPDIDPRKYSFGSLENDDSLLESGTNFRESDR